jgi:hypothetical protein
LFFKNSRTDIKINHFALFALIMWTLKLNAREKD